MLEDGTSTHAAAAVAKVMIAPSLLFFVYRAEEQLWVDWQTLPLAVPNMCGIRD